eukprot:6189136-Pleurochrysis_carterae.AAC.2
MRACTASLSSTSAFVASDFTHAQADPRARRPSLASRARACQVTMSTVGYGEMVPITPLGYVIGALTIVGGYVPRAPRHARTHRHVRYTHGETRMRALHARTLTHARAFARAHTYTPRAHTPRAREYTLCARIHTALTRAHPHSHALAPLGAHAHEAAHARTLTPHAHAHTGTRWPTYSRACAHAHTCGRTLRTACTRVRVRAARTRTHATRPRRGRLSRRCGSTLLNWNLAIEPARSYVRLLLGHRFLQVFAPHLPADHLYQVLGAIRFGYQARRALPADHDHFQHV